jgi:hypothetical protein
MDSLLEVLVKRDGLSKDEALRQIEEAKEEVRNGQEPGQLLEDWFGLEPDYIYDLFD